MPEFLWKSRHSGHACQLYNFIMDPPIEVVYEEIPTLFNPKATLQEIAHGLAAGDLEEVKRIRFTTMVNGQMVGIGDDIMLQTLRQSATGSLRLVASYKKSSSRSSRSSRSSKSSKYTKVSRAPSEYSIVESESCSNFASLETSATTAAALRYKVGYNGPLGEEKFLRLQGSLMSLSLFDIGQQIIEAQGLATHSYTCYLYNKCGWPLAANIEQSLLIKGESYLVNGDWVFAIIWEERPPQREVYADPVTGGQLYCFDYSEETFIVGLEVGCKVSNIRRKLVWLLKVPYNTITVATGDGVVDLQDDYTITAADISNKQLTFKFGSLTTSFSHVSDLYASFDANETRKLYGYLHLLKAHTPKDARKSVTHAAYLLGQKSEPFLFAFYQLLQDSPLTKAERVALAHGCRLMYRTYTSFITSDTAQDVSLMVGLLYNLASVCDTELAGLVTVTECAEEEALPVRCFISDDPVKEEVLIKALKRRYLTLPLVEIKSNAHTFVDYLTSTGVRLPLLPDLLNRYIRETSFLPILHPRDISNGTQNRLTYHPNGQLWVNRGLEESSHNIDLDMTAMLSDLLTGQSFNLKKSDLITQVEKYLPTEGTGVVVTREPEEAIVVIFDTSGSMSTKYQREDTNTRLDAAKTFFLLFAQKTQAYDYPHVFSLFTFAGAASFRFDFTENMDTFLELVQGLKPSGNTALYSAMEQGLIKLQAIKQKYPKVLPRIMIVSDGEDNESQITAKAISDLVVAQGVVVDIFAVGGNCALAKLISKRSGGYCYYTDTIIDGVRTFEAETILKVGLRLAVPVSLPRMVTEEDFIRVSASVPFDRDPPKMRQPVDVDGKVCSSLRAFEQQVAVGIENPLAAKRVLRELARYNHDPHSDFSLFPLSKNLFIWRGLVEGPPGTPYEGGIFDFYVSFGEGYPSKAPEMRFLTPISHPNVTQNGKICHPIFTTNYTTETSIRQILDNVYGLLLMQDFDDYVVSNLDITLSFDKQQFRVKAKEATQRYAIRGKTREQLVKEIMVDDDCPEKYRCPLTRKLMRDPVYSPRCEKAFERAAIEAHLRQTGRDPLTNLPLRADELVADFRLRQEIYRLYPL